MQIDKAIMSVDDNPLYEGFWPLISMVWKKRFNITPELIYFGSKKQDSTYGEVKYVDAVPEIPTHLQCQWARFFYTRLERESTYITTDIDMFPISKSFFIDQISHVNNDAYVHLFGSHRPMPACYHVAKGKCFQDVMRFEEDFESEMIKIHELSQGHQRHMGMSGWGVDESHSTEMLLSYDGDRQKHLFPSTVRSKFRLDRSNWNYEYNLSNYIDSHSLRPLKCHMSSIQQLAEDLVR